MIRNSRSLTAILFFLVLFAAACGPSPEEQAATAAAGTAAAATDTPLPTHTPTDTPVPTSTPTNTPTPTATPVPFDLSLLVADEAGNPIEGATVTFAELDETARTGPDGLLSWTDLPGEAATLSASAQGYLPGQLAAALERGTNEVTLTLSRDPFGVLPAEACRPGETLRHVEDFQDGDASNWPNIMFGANGWGFGEFAAEPGNLVAFNRMPEVHPHAYLDGFVLDQFAIRFDYFVSGPADMSFNLLHADPYEDAAGNQIEDSRYMVIVGGTRPTPGFSLRRHQSPVLDLGLLDTVFPFALGEWHFMELSRFEGHVQLWVDGVLAMQYQDPQPLPPGNFNIEIFESTAPDAVPTFDNFALCELSAPFEPLFVPAAAPEE